MSLVDGDEDYLASEHLTRLLVRLTILKRFLTSWPCFALSIFFTGRVAIAIRCITL